MKTSWQAVAVIGVPTTAVTAGSPNANDRRSFWIGNRLTSSWEKRIVTVSRKPEFPIQAMCILSQTECAPNQPGRYCQCPAEGLRGEQIVGWRRQLTGGK
jgi:hypothetical protein